MSQHTGSYTVEKLYEETYNIKYNWQKILPEDVLQFHNLVAQQTNAPVGLQMGTALAFVASFMGPKTIGHFLTTPSLFKSILDCHCHIGYCWQKSEKKTFYY